VSRITRLFTFLALMPALAGVAACERSPQVNAAPKPPAVTVVAVTQRSVPVYGQYVGQTEAVKTVEVRARVEGFIERQVVPDGATVKAGDLLFTIDPRPLEAPRAREHPSPGRRGPPGAVLAIMSTTLLQERKLPWTQSRKRCTPPPSSVPSPTVPPTQS
jgi:Biotin-lipoyl like